MTRSQLVHFTIRGAAIVVGWMAIFILPWVLGFSPWLCVVIGVAAVVAVVVVTYVYVTRVLLPYLGGR